MSNSDRPIYSQETCQYFRCIASDCPMTCCQEWTIGVDDRTLHRWKTTLIDNVPLTSFVEKDFTGHHRIRLTENHLCPWLTEKGLCKIVLSKGEEYLSVTCDTFPRQNHQFTDRAEKSLLNGCPEVLHLLSIGIAPFPQDVAISDSLANLSIDTILNDDDYLTLPALRVIRTQICTKLKDSSSSLSRTLFSIFCWLTDLWENEPDATTSWELLNRSITPPTSSSIDHTNLNSFFSSEVLAECSELFLDFTENYHTEHRYTRILSPLRSEAEIMVDNDGKDPLCSAPAIASYMQLVNEYDSFFRSLLVSDCYSSLLAEETDLTTMIHNYQWILLRWVCIRQSLLFSLISAQKDSTNFNSDTLSREQIQSIISTIYRITSFNEKDICEALTSMFDEVIFPQEYAALVLGI